ncbi:hypothetical protein T03_6921 [Trichinella britovi]|uniref:Uncharacterized protein n=1 Tax=Trichinella britovi TaxID=45882 RepID=A0A0V1CSE7_TRIBR|nr:hypothetical protein T03_6921 [Trichinella britovi]
MMHLFCSKLIFASHLTSFPESFHVFRCCVYSEIDSSCWAADRMVVSDVVCSMVLYPYLSSVYKLLGLRKAMIYMNEFGNVLFIFYREIANAVDEVI